MGQRPRQSGMGTARGGAWEGRGYVIKEEPNESEETEEDGRGASGRGRGEKERRAVT